MSELPHIPSLFDLSDRTAVVVGSASGLGRATAVGLADAGACVICGDLNTDGAQETAQIIASRGGTAEAVALDITSTENVEEVAQRFADAEVLKKLSKKQVVQLISMVKKQMDIPSHKVSVAYRN